MYRNFPGVAIGSDAIYILGSGAMITGAGPVEYGAAILKCPTTSIAHQDCATFVGAREEAFYLDAQYQQILQFGTGPNGNYVLADM